MNTPVDDATAFAIAAVVFANLGWHWSCVFMVFLFWLSVKDKK